MPARHVVRRRVTAGRVVAAADVAARLAHAQVDPACAVGQAVLAAGNGFRELEAFYRVEVAAGSQGAMVAGDAGLCGAQSYA